MYEILFVLNNVDGYDGLDGGDGKVHLLVREIDNITFNVAQCGAEVDRRGGYEHSLMALTDYFSEYPIPEEKICNECFGLED